MSGGGPRSEGGGPALGGGGTILTRARLETLLRDGNPLVRDLAQEVLRLRAELNRANDPVNDARNSQSD